MRLFTLLRPTTTNREVIDGNNNTFSTNTAHTLTLVSSGSTTYDAIYVVCSGATQWVIDAPSTTISLSAINTRGNQQYSMHVFSTTQTDNEITITFTGSNVQVYNIMILRTLFEISADLSRYDYRSIDRGITRQSANRRNNYIPPLGGNPDAWQCRGSTEFYRNAVEKAKCDDFIHTIRNNKPLVFAPDAIAEPDLVFEANMAIDSVSYMGRMKGAGRRARWNANGI